MSDADLPMLLADAPPEVRGRALLAVAAMHEPDETGRCRWCGRVAGSGGVGGPPSHAAPTG